MAARAWPDVEALARWKPADSLLVAAILLYALAALRGIGGASAAAPDGATVRVLQDNRPVLSVPLAAPGRYPLADGRLVLAVEGGTARVVASRCPAKTCERMGAIRIPGQSVICAPNHLLIEIVSPKDEPPGEAVDAVAR